MVLPCSCRGISSSFIIIISSSSAVVGLEVVMQPFIHFLPQKSIQKDVNKSFPVAMDNAGLNEYSGKIPSFKLSNKKDVPELSQQVSS